MSRVTPVHTAVRNCTRDEGRPFEVGNQVLISSHRKLLLSNDVEKVRRVLGEALADIARALDGKDLVEPGNDPRLIP